MPQLLFAFLCVFPNEVSEGSRWFRCGPLKRNLFASRSLQLNLTPENICRATRNSRCMDFSSLLFLSRASL